MDRRFALSHAVLALGLFAGASASLAQDPIGMPPLEPATDSVRYLTWTYKDAPMGLYLPAHPTKGLPVVMFLHPCHNDPVYEGHWINAALNAIEPVAVFAPTAVATAGENSCADWGGTYDAGLRPQMVNALHELDSLIRVFQFDSTRRYLYGESMGGEGVYRLLMDFPGRFAGGVSVGGYSVNKGAAQMARTPLWILIGTEDELSPIADTRTIHQAIVQAGGTQVKLTELPGLGHVPAIEQVRTDSSVVRWLLRQSPTSSVSPRAVAPRSISTPFAFRDGSIFRKPGVPGGSRIRLWGMDGTPLATLEPGMESISLPTGPRGGVVLWRASSPRGVGSGRALIAP